MSTLRILHCLRAPVGGLFRHVRDLAIEQASRGHLVGVLCDSLAADTLTEQRLTALAPQLALGLHRTAMSREIGWRDITAIRTARHLSRSLALDVLHGHGAKGGASARLATDIARGSTNTHRPGRFYTPHGGSLHYDPRSLKGAIFMTLERQLAGLTDGLIFESAFAAARYAEKVGAPQCAQRVIFNGLQPSEFTSHETAPDAADVLFVGELRELKGVDVLIEAIARLAGERPIRAVIVGDGPDTSAFKDKAASLGVSERVTFTGAMPAQAAFPLGQVMVVPSRAESLPYIVLEAAARTMPLIATDVGGIPEIVAGTDTALVPPGDVGALADAIRAALASPRMAQARAERLRAAVEARFTVATMTDAVLDFYRTARSL